MKPESQPDWLAPDQWLDHSRNATPHDVERAIHARHHSEEDFAALISPAATPMLESMAQRARLLTQQHFGNTISLYAPLYLSDYCSAGCVYCGFSSDLEKPRKRLTTSQTSAEIESMKSHGFDEILLLTGDRTKEANTDYLVEHTAVAANHVNQISVETFAMTTEEYSRLVDAGCTSVALYQETYDTQQFIDSHRWGPKVHYLNRLEAPSRALQAGMRSISLGVLLGLADPRADTLALYRHARHLLSRHWQSGIAISFPRIRPQLGDFKATTPVSEQALAQIIFAFRICFPEIGLNLSTRETPAFRDGMAGVGVNKMSVASKTTVGGYAEATDASGQFDISDERSVETFCHSLRARGLEPVFKSWDAVYRLGAVSSLSR